MDANFYTEIDCQQNIHHGDLICGDVFLTKRIKEENRIIIALSDGMGSGIKANVLATLTASMAINFTTEHKEVQRTAEIIMNTLPVCSVRKVSYSTFTIVDIEYDGTTRIIEYDNPGCLIMRGTTVFDPGWTEISLETKNQAGKTLKSCVFIAQKEDRIFFWSDGVVQSGMGSKQYPFGWGQPAVCSFVKDLVRYTPFISARKLARKVINMAALNDSSCPKDDTSCVVVYFREPRKLLLVTGPPYEEGKDLEYAMMVHNFHGKKIIAGGTTAEIITRELGLKSEVGMHITDPDLPPVSHVDGINLVTEGIMTIGKVAMILDKYNNEYVLSNGPADRIVKEFLECDKIHIVVGTRINVAHQDPNLPIELEIRRTVVKKIVKLLEEKLLKEVVLQFI
jgi:hypothetical protein